MESSMVSPWSPPHWSWRRLSELAIGEGCGMAIGEGCGMAIGEGGGMAIGEGGGTAIGEGGGTAIGDWHWLTWVEP